jgi:gliding motility-associated-like protein
MNLPRSFLSAVFFLGILKISFAQTVPAFDCSFDGLLKSEKEIEIQSFEENLRQYILQKNFQERFSAPPYIVPVVVHVIHDNGPENISDAQIITAVQHLNEAFAAQGYYAQQGATVDSKIQFCLAKRDPDGNSTTGIIRTKSSLTNMVVETDDILLKNLSRWKPTDYVNIWVVKEITSQSSGAAVAGYAYFPTSHGDPEDGMVCEAKYFGTTAAEDAIFIHEMGHYFGLYHTFQGGCPNADCNLDGDRVCDTPPDQAKHTVCNYNSCSTDMAAGSPFLTDVDDFTGDFMDYSPFSCYHFFTAGQAARMQGVVETTRKSLLDSKGCGDPCLLSVAAQFSMPSGSYFAGQPVNLTNQSTGATNYSWEANGVFFSNLTDPSFVFPTIGSFEIILTATNNDPNCVSKFSKTVTASCPVMADFSASSTSVDPGTVVNFTNTSTGATGYEWFINGVLLGTSSNFSYTFSTVGDYTVILEATNGACKSHQSVFVKVNSPCAGSDGAAQFLYNIGNFNFYPYCATATPDGGLLTYGKQVDNNNSPALIQKTDKNGDIQWAKRFENAVVIFKAIASPIDDTYVLLSENSNGNTVFLMKMDAATGATVWKKDFTNLKSSGFIYDLVVLPDGDLLALMERGTVARFTAAGNLVWAKKLDVDVADFLTSMTRRPDGTILITGSEHKLGFSKSSVIFLDENGVVLDTKYYGSSAVTQMVVLNDVVVNSDNSFTVAGSYRSPGGSFSDQRGLVFKCDAAGNILWSKKLDFEASSSHSAVKNYIVKTSDGGYILWGSPFVMFTNRLLMKIDGSGNMLWGREFQVPSITTNLANIAENGTPGCWIAQHGSNRLLIAKVDGNGSAGGCNEIEHQIPVSDLSLAVQSAPLLISDFPLDVATGNLDWTPVNFQKQTLCSQPIPCPEICDNQLDDDSDGYVDCYDADCDCFEMPDTSCTVVQDLTGFSIKQAWKSDASIVLGSTTPFVANLDPQTDSIPEILVVGKSSSSFGRAIRIFKGDGSDKSSPKKLEIPGWIYNYASANMVIADLDRDGIPELIVPGLDSKIHVFNHFDPNTDPPMKLWVSSVENTVANHGEVAVADFDADGVPEIFTGNEIFKLDLTNPASPTLHLLLKGMGDGGFSSSGFGTASSTAADLLSVNDCNGDPDCDGLELVGGGSIYSIDLDPVDGDGLEIKEKRNLNLLDPTSTNFKDGFTAIADIDLDGLPEVVINTSIGSGTTFKYGVAAWNKNGLVGFFHINSSAPPFGSGGPILVANVFDDKSAGFALDFPEIIVVGQNKVFCFNQNAASLNSAAPFWWSLNVVDGSGRSGASVFDFNGDGALEIVYRDEMDLRVLYGGAAPFPPGVDADRNWATFPVTSPTNDEYPIVADVDADHQAEIIVTGDSQTSATLGRLFVFESATYAWPDARPVWNQYNYFGLNINDDFTVPKTQQKHWLEMGGIGSGKRPFNAHLAQVSSLNPLTTYKINAPDITLALDSAQCKMSKMEAHFTICNQGGAPLPAGTPVTFYTHDPTVVAAVPLAPPLFFNEILEAGECNNLVLSLGATYNLPVFVVINDDATVPTPFNLKNDFPATDQQECNYENNIVNFQINYNPPTLNLGPDIFLCKNSVVELTADPGFEKYRWQDGSTEPKFTAFFPGKYWVDATDGCGFVHSDTVEIIENTLKKIDLPDVLSVCVGDTVNLDAPGFLNYSWSPADSVNCSNCSSVQILAKKSFTIFVTAADGDCFVSDSVQIKILPPPFVDFLVENGVCTTPGSITAQVSGNAPFQFLWENLTTDSVINASQPGTYAIEITDVNGCKTVDSASVSILNSLEISAISTNPKCANSETGAIDLMVNNGTAPFQFLWSNGSTTEDLTNLGAGNYDVLVIDANGCSATFADTLTDPNFSIGIIHVSGGDCGNSINLQLIGNTPGPNQILWSNGSTSGNISVFSGVYTVTVTDVNGCEYIDSHTAVTQPVPIPTATITPPTCWNTQDASVSIAVTGVPSWGVVWITGPIIPASNNTNPTGLPPGIYEYVAVASNNCFTKDTFEIIAPPEMNLEITAQNGDCTTPAILSASADGAPPIDFVWENGIQNPSANFFESGTYAVTATDANGCTATEAADALVLGKPTAVLAADSVSCFGGSDGKIEVVSSAGGVPPLMYSIDNQAFTTNLVFENLKAGIYQIYVRDADDCLFSQEIEVGERAPFFVDLTGDSHVAAGENVNLTAVLTPSNFTPTDIIWLANNSVFSNSMLEQVVQLFEKTIFQIKILNENGCSATDSLLVLVDAGHEIYVPNIIFPENPTGSNQKFTVFSGAGIVEIASLEIFDRWGNLIFSNQKFQSNDENEGWDGTFRGKKVSAGVYVWSAKVVFDNGKTEVFKGDLTIIR